MSLPYLIASLIPISKNLCRFCSNVGHYLLLDLSQRSDEWLKWRDNGIGASDAPTIMGETRWKTRDSLLREKVYGAPERKTATMIRGIELEPEALIAYQKHNGIKLRPVCIQSQYFPWLRASLDGLSYDGQRVVEIKCGESVYRHTSRYKQPPRYYYATTAYPGFNRPAINWLLVLLARSTIRAYYRHARWWLYQEPA